MWPNKKLFLLTHAVTLQLIVQHYCAEAYLGGFAHEELRVCWTELSQWACYVREGHRRPNMKNGECVRSFYVSFPLSNLVKSPSPMSIWHLSKHSSYFWVLPATSSFSLRETSSSFEKISKSFSRKFLELRKI